MTRQETFDIVARALAAQGFPSVRFDEEGQPLGCSYRGAEGRKCAAGHLIPDAAYSPEFEASTVFSAKIQRVIQAEGHDLKLVRALQSAHDEATWTTIERGIYNSRWLAAWAKNMRRVAKDFALSTPVLDSALNEARKSNMTDVMMKFSAENQRLSIELYKLNAARFEQVVASMSAMVPAALEGDERQAVLDFIETTNAPTRTVLDDSRELAEHMQRVLDAFDAGRLQEAEALLEEQTALSTKVLRSTIELARANTGTITAALAALGEAADKLAVN